VVLVATLRALKYHGGVGRRDAARPDQAALERGLPNLEKHLETARAFGLVPIVALNRRADDTDEELAWVCARLGQAGVEAGVADVFAHGGRGARELASRVWSLAKAAPARPPARPLYELTTPPEEKLRQVARTVYGADDVLLTAEAKKQLQQAVALGFGELPVCFAKTHLSLSDDERARGRPRGFVITVRQVRISAGAGFLVVLTGDILTMPGLPRRPQGVDIDLDGNGTIRGIN
jgi:formate--tetrahydrofolate ligase